MRSLERATSSCSSSQHTPHGGWTINLDEVVEKNNKGYKSCDDNDDA